MIRVYNTLTKQKEELKQPEGKALQLFVCGPTVYGYIHIGNARTYVNFDTIVRYLNFVGWKVFYLQNITDIDDKIIAAAKEEKISPLKLARKYERAYHEDEKALRIHSVTKYARATSFIPHIIKQIETLIRKGNVYKIESDGYYFDLSSFKNYGHLAGRTVAQAEDGISRIDESPNKKNRGDFAVWKFSKADEPTWKTKIGNGRPGWHIEDTAITEHHFGPQYDVHGGGIDLIFPHHEAEIAIEESVSGKTPLVQLWMHSGMLALRDMKMSKSVGNIVTIRDFLKDNSANVFRLIAAQTHYRSRCEYGDKVVESSRATLKNVTTVLEKLRLISRSRNPSIKSSNLSFEEFTEKIEKEFHKAMSDDFNVPGALGALFSLINALHKESIWELSPAQAQKILTFLSQHFGVLGIEFKNRKPPRNVRALTKQRELSRDNKQFDKADALRNEIKTLGYTIEDTPLGPLLVEDNV